MTETGRKMPQKERKKGKRANKSAGKGGERDGNDVALNPDLILSGMVSIIEICFLQIARPNT